jgi:hypothetical protein
MDIYELERLRVAGPLSEETRKVRKSLLISSIVGWAFVRVGLVPTKISALGIELSTKDQSAFYVLAALIVGYFLVSFIVDAATDVINWWLVINSKYWQLDKDDANEERETLLKEHQVPEPLKEIYGNVGRRQGAMWRGSSYSRNINRAGKISSWMFWLRLCFDCAIPTTAGIYVLVLLVQGALAALTPAVP